MDADPRRQVRVYVFALLTHQDKDSVDPLELAQWKFYVLPSARLDQDKGGQQSIGLNSLRALAPPVAYWDLKRAVDEVGR